MASYFIYYLIIFVIIECSYQEKYEIELFLVFKYLLLLCMILSPLGWFAGNVLNRCLFYFSFLSIVFFSIALYSNKRVCISYNLLVLVISFLLYFWLHAVILRENSFFPYTSKILCIS
jgi:hypothetical protein